MHEYFELLDDIRDSGKINMFESYRFIMDEFGESKYKAKNIVREWMENRKW